MFNMKEFLNMSEVGQRVEIGRHIYPKPWPHLPSNEGDIICARCRLVLKRVQRSKIGPDNIVEGYLAVPNGNPECPVPMTFEGSLADLAFRLRDEARGKGEGIKKLTEAMALVHRHCDCGINKMYSPTLIGDRSWFLFSAQPIHWIAAALQAKGMSK